MTNEHYPRSILVGEKMPKGSLMTIRADQRLWRCGADEVPYRVAPHDLFRDDTITYSVKAKVVEE
jgi:hypothetical protein